MERQPGLEKKGEILIVDDLPENILLLFNILTQENYEVRRVINGQQAINVVRSDPPDLILLDIMMPELDGYQVCQQIKANADTENIPIIFISAKQDPLDKIKAFQSGGADYITKPFQVEEVLARVENQLNLLRMQKALTRQKQVLEEEVKRRRQIEQALQSQEDFLKTIIDANPNLILVKDQNGKFILVNQALADLYGKPVHELLGKTDIELARKFPQVPQFQRLDQEVISFWQTKIITETVTTNNGDVHWFYTVKKPILAPNQQQAYILVVSTDITERMRAEASLLQQAEQQRLLAAIAQNIRESLDLEQILKKTVTHVREFLMAERVMIARPVGDANYQIIVETVATERPPLLGVKITDHWLKRLSRSWEKTGKIEPDIIENVENLLLFSVKQSLSQLQVKSQLVLPIFHNPQFILGDTTKNASVQPLSAYHSIVSLSRPTVWGLLIVHQCSTARHWQVGEIEVLCSLASQVAIAIQQGELLEQLEQTNQKLHDLAISDALTGLANRRYFDQYLQQEWQRLKREQQNISMILGDVDFFKKYNDNYGHQMGDQCLQMVAKAIKSCVKRPADLVARYGGEEFAVILPNTDLEGALLVAKDIKNTIEDLKISHFSSEVNQYVTISLGVASLIPQSSASQDILIKAADDALYSAKDLGRNRIEIAQVEDIFN